MKTSRPSAAQPDAPAPSLSTRVRIGLSALIVVHLAAVFVPPWSLPPSSLLANIVRQSLHIYVEAMYLDHGYRFFAPDPGAESHMVRYELKFVDGREESEVFPDRQRQWPRLRYHRHFMLSEFLNSLAPPPPESGAPPIESNPEAKRLLDAHSRAYAQHLLQVTGAEEVTLYRRTHLIPSPLQVLDGATLDDPDSYRDDLLGHWRKDE